MRRQGDTLRLVFPFVELTPAAVFRRADMLWLVFDTGAPVDISRLVMQPIAAIRSAVVTRSREGQVVRIRLDRPKLASVTSEGSAWTVAIGDTALGPTLPLALGRAVGMPGHASAVVALDGAQQVHRLSDPEVGDTLLVVTAFAPARGFIKPQNFVEFRALASTHGVVVQPLADDIAVEVLPGKVVIGRSAGLILSSTGFRVPATGQVGETGEGSRRPGGAYRPAAFDPQLWGFDQGADFLTRQSELIRAAAEAPEGRRAAARLDLARFYLARHMYPEAKGVLDAVVADAGPAIDDPSALVLRAATNILIGRGPEALKDLGHPIVGTQLDAGLWRAMALVREGKFAEARAGFAGLETTAASLPLELQRVAFRDALRAAIEVGDYADAATQLHQFELIGVPADMAPSIAVLKGRLAEGLGSISEALDAYREAGEFARPPRRRPGGAAPHRAALRHGRAQAPGSDRGAGKPHHAVARRPDRGRGAADPRPALHRGGPLPRRFPDHAGGARRPQGLRDDAPADGGGRREL